ncbi:TetR/AcrR family transcriptional regulator [Paenibacillus mucilaginosus]|uniref:TetR family transcriptional regulator n=2 Tax=Paenibacillus mucilaginosus TaxID=61624 RepID=H6NFQ7_9BACL|nr:TetR/AcrR family transcriptional regulator [Paenibacillus mucilaginosus]AEI43006.1 transcriptional regulator, TetR family [Paenibacillus mucilaginosus KNP414]AFC30697.1 TetR family transcriptional regulator [Paenibacillus mucilaginosus 3016]MCG7216118.1 TetR/AcrR family transcriptional regulator [Paenibacillus mucilaginosus]WDM24633.1 TetR/AcrR family transcriptional regulator [Paenibacillus mucilaginosus]WFA19307.1 TetR/AcrR family transcriptional regulator [Paenibacillus mucilaginosus]
MAVREDKKERIIESAVALFAENGYYKTTTGQVAKAAGVTQPYVFHFFANKEALFKAVIDRACARINEAFAGVEEGPERLKHAMGCVFTEIMKAHHSEILLAMQAHAIAEPEIREHVRRHYRQIHDTVTDKFEKAGVSQPDKEASRFVGIGFLIAISDVMDLPMLNGFYDSNEGKDTCGDVGTEGDDWSEVCV